MKHLKIYNAIRLIQRQGSIRKAAEILAVSPSALNRSLQGFEDAIGVQVFERIPAGVRLTSAGELLLSVIDRHLVEFGELQRQFGNLRDGNTGTLRVGIGQDIAAGLPLAAIADVEAEMEGVSVFIPPGNEMRLLRNREADLAVVTNPETDPSIEVLASQQVPLAALATSEWDMPQGRIGFWDLLEGRLVLPPENTGSRTMISHAMRRYGLEERITTSVAAPQLRQVMAAGPRACIFPRSVFDATSAEAGFTLLPLELGSVQVSVLRLSGFPLSRPAQCFLRHMERRLDTAFD